MRARSIAFTLLCFLFLACGPTETTDSLSCGQGGAMSSGPATAMMKCWGLPACAKVSSPRSAIKGRGGRSSPIRRAMRRPGCESIDRTVNSWDSSASTPRCRCARCGVAACGQRGSGGSRPHDCRVPRHQQPGRLRWVCQHAGRGVMDPRNLIQFGSERPAASAPGWWPAEPALSSRDTTMCTFQQLRAELGGSFPGAVSSQPRGPVRTAAAGVVSSLAQRPSRSDPRSGLGPGARCSLYRRQPLAGPDRGAFIERRDLQGTIRWSRRISDVPVDAAAAVPFAPDGDVLVSGSSFRMIGARSYGGQMRLSRSSAPTAGRPSGQAGRLAGRRLGGRHGRRCARACLSRRRDAGVLAEGGVYAGESDVFVVEFDGSGMAGRLAGRLTR